jgi:hypothetical protein
MHPTTSPDIGQRLLRGQRRQTVAIDVLFLVVMAISGYALKKANEIHDALCTFDGDLQSRVARSEDFILHPEKYPGVHIDPKIIVPQVESQKQTLDSLNGLGCTNQ